jgi:hypothetical protein
LAQLLQLHASFWVSLERPGHHQQQLYICVLVDVVVFVVVFVWGYARSSFSLCKMNLLQELVKQSPESAIKANSTS